MKFTDAYIKDVVSKYKTLRDLRKDYSFSYKNRVSLLNFLRLLMELISTVDARLSYKRSNP